MDKNKACGGHALRIGIGIVVMISFIVVVVSATPTPGLWKIDYGRDSNFMVSESGNSIINYTLHYGCTQPWPPYLHIERGGPIPIINNKFEDGNYSLSGTFDSSTHAFVHIRPFIVIYTDIMGISHESECVGGGNWTASPVVAPTPTATPTPIPTSTVTPTPISTVTPAPTPAPTATPTPTPTPLADTWSVAYNGTIIEINYGNGTNFPQYAALDTNSSYLRLIAPDTNWGTSIVLLPSFWENGTNGTPTLFQGAPVSNQSYINNSDIVFLLNGTISNLTTNITLRISPPLKDTDTITANISVNVSGNETLDNNHPGEAFKPVMLSSMHINSSVWDASSAFVDSQEFTIPGEGWIIPPPPVISNDFGLNGGSSTWKTNAPTVEIILNNSYEITGWVTNDSNPNDDNIGFWAASNETVRTWDYEIKVSKPTPTPTATPTPTPTVTSTPTPTGSISGMKFNDLNNNSVKDVDESGLANWTIDLTDQNGSSVTATTDKNGNYTFSDLTPSNYTVAEVLKTGWIQTFPENGTYNATITGNESITGIDFGNNLAVPLPTNVTGVTAVRTIEKKSLRLGESTNVTVNISSTAIQALSLKEIIPAGWNLTRISDDADAFKNSTNEWIWFNVTPRINKTIIYRLTAPDNASIGTYHINGTISSTIGVIAVVQGDNTITIDILAYYRGIGSDPNIVETTDLLKAMDDWRSKTVPVGFANPITNQELSALINEWVMT